MNNLREKFLAALARYIDAKIAERGATSDESGIHNAYSEGEALTLALDEMLDDTIQRSVTP